MAAARRRLWLVVVLALIVTSHGDHDGLHGRLQTGSVLRISTAAEVIELVQHMRSACSSGPPRNPDNVFYKHMVANKEKRKNKERTAPLILAHRGYFAKFQENTMAAIQSALDLGIEGVEIDIRHTKDNVLYVFHDETVKRLTGKEGSIETLTSEQVKALVISKKIDPGNGKEVEYPSTQSIATFDEFLALLKTAKDNGKVLAVDLDCKSETLIGSTKVGKMIGEAVVKAGVSSFVVATSFYPKTIKGVGESSPILTGFGYDDNIPAVGSWWVHNNQFETDPFRFRDKNWYEKLGEWYQALGDKASSVLHSLVDSVKCHVTGWWSSAHDYYDDIIHPSTIPGKIAFKTLEEIAAFYMKATDAVCMEHTVITKKLVETFHDRGYIVGSYTVFEYDRRFAKKSLTRQQDINVLISLAKIGVDWVETDDPLTTKLVIDEYLATGKTPEWKDILPKIPKNILGMYDEDLREDGPAPAPAPTPGSQTPRRTGVSLSSPKSSSNDNRGKSGSKSSKQDSRLRQSN